jgi:lipopolysaccharide biosynthesis protein
VEPHTLKTIAVIIYLYYLDLWKEFGAHLANLQIPYDPYLTLPIDNPRSPQLERRIKSRFPHAQILMFENRESDVGPFVEIIKSIIRSNRKYDYVLKAHETKSLLVNPAAGESKRKAYFQTLFNNDGIRIVLDAFAQSPSIICMHNQIDYNL